MNDQKQGKGSGLGNGSSSDSDDEEFAEYLYDEPLTAREYIKFMFYFILTVIIGVQIAVLLFVVNK